MRRAHLAGWCGLAALVLMTAGPVHAQQITWDGNLIYNNSPDSCNDAATGGFTEGQVLRTLFTHNRFLNPLLVDPSIAGHNFRPTTSSPALCQNFHPVVVLPNDGFFQQTTYAGALSPNPAEDWTQAAWTTYAVHGNPADFNLGKPLVTLTGNLTTRTLVNTNNYIIEGRVRVGSGQILTIQAGTVLFGSSTVTPSFLEIDRGGKLIAIGTSASPIIFTSENAPGGTANPGDWGGVVLNGRACANCANTAAGDSCNSEGGNAGTYGGTDDHDNSGTLQYCRFEFCGFAVALDSELNCITMNGLGDGTQIGYLESNGGFDDLFEWFGGTVNAHHLLGLHGDDDGLDFQMGYRGKVQFAVIQQNPDNITIHVDKGIEGDNNEFNFANPLCRSNPTFANLTFIGARQQNPATTLGGPGIHFRRGARGQVLNSIVLGFHLCGFDFDDTETTAGGFGPNGTVYCSGVSGVEDPAADNTPGSRAFPNPFRTTAHIAFSLPKTSQAAVRVYSVDGRLVDVVLDRELAAGEHDLTWNAPSDLSNGLFFYSIDAGAYQAKGRLILAR